MSGSAQSRNHQPRGKRAQPSIPTKTTTRSPARVKKTRAFLLTKTYMEGGDTGVTCKQMEFPLRGPDAWLPKKAPAKKAVAKEAPAEEAVAETI
jgi:hypothetical protein